MRKTIQVIKRKVPEAYTKELKAQKNVNDDKEDIGWKRGCRGGGVVRHRFFNG